MARNFGKILLVLLVASACRRQSPPPPGAAAPPGPAPTPAPTVTGSPEPKLGTSETPPPPATAETAEKKAEAVEPAGGRPVAAGQERDVPSPAATGAPETAKRKSAARAAAEQQHPAAKQRGARPKATKVAAAASEAKPEAPSEAAAPDEKVAAAAEPTAQAAAEPTAQAAAEPTPPTAAEPTAQAAAEPTAHATVRFKNEAGNTYKLVEARFVMDGAELPTVLTSGPRGQTQQVFSGQVAPGRHVIASRITYQGADRAIFTYMKGYTFRVQSDDTFEARGTKPVAMTIICKEKTGFNDPVEKRLFVTVE